MEETNIRKYAKLMQELGLTGLEVSEDGSQVRLEMSNAQTSSAAPVVSVPPSTSAPESPDLVSICSPMVGVFYSAPAENQPPFVKVGDRVKKGDPLCIIGAMKLMNEITSDQDGIITEICVENNHVVEFGHILFRIRKESL